MQRQKKHDGKRKILREVSIDVIEELESQGFDRSEELSKFLADFKKARKSRSKKNMQRVGV